MCLLCFALLIRLFASQQYSLMGMQLFLGHFRTRCYDLATGILSNLASDPINNGPLCHPNSDLLSAFPGRSWSVACPFELCAVDVFDIAALLASFAPIAATILIKASSFFRSKCSSPDSPGRRERVRQFRAGAADQHHRAIRRRLVQHHVLCTRTRTLSNLSREISFEISISRHLLFAQSMDAVSTLSVLYWFSMMAIANLIAVQLILSVMSARFEEVKEVGFPRTCVLFAGRVVCRRCGSS